MTQAQEIGTIIKTFREKKKLSQKQLSKKIFGNETHHAAISRLENGKHDEVKFETVVNTLDALGVNLFKILKKRI